MTSLPGLEGLRVVVVLKWAGLGGAERQALLLARHLNEVAGAALTASPCRVSARPLTFLDGKLDYPGCEKRWSDSLDPHRRGILARASRAHSERGRGEPFMCTRHRR